jgi:hypothetical protein
LDGAQLDETPPQVVTIHDGVEQGDDVAVGTEAGEVLERQVDRTRHGPEATQVAELVEVPASSVVRGNDHAPSVRVTADPGLSCH